MFPLFVRASDSRDAKTYQSVTLPKLRSTQEWSFRIFLTLGARGVFQTGDALQGRRAKSFATLSIEEKT
jgi:hypothetical protein